MAGRNSVVRSRRRAHAFGGTLVSAAALMCLTGIGHASIVYSSDVSFIGTNNVILVGNTGTGTYTVDGSASTSAPYALTLTGTTGTNAQSGYIAVGGTSITSGTGTLTVTNGGVIDINSAQGNGTAGINAGIGGGTGTVTVTGDGSTISVTGSNAGDNGDGYTIGRSGTGTLNVSNGGSVIEDNTSTGVGGLSIGGNADQVAHSGTPGTGTVTVSGTGSSGTDATIDLESAHANLFVGYSGTGTLNVDQGGSVTTVNTYVGNLGSSSGTLTVNQGGSLATQNLYMGYSDSSTGTVTINQGGTVNIVAPTGTQPDIALGSNSFTSTDATSGTLTVNGGSLNVSSTSLAPIVSAGGGTNSTGTITVENGGQMTGLSQVIVGAAGNGSLSVESGGTAVFSNTNPGTGKQAQPVLVIGGDGTQVSDGVSPGSGAVTVSGTGASISFSASNGLVIAGYSGNGSLNVNNGGAISAEQLNVGQFADSSGNVTISGKGSSLTLSGSNSINNSGSLALIGESGTGTVTISDDAELTVNATNTAAGTTAGIIVGGNGSQAGGTGIFAVTGGSTVSINNTAGGGVVLSIGRNGTGTMTIDDSTVGVSYGSGTVGGVYVGALASASSAAATAPMVGTLTVADGSTLNTGGILAVADDRTTSDSRSGYVGTGTVTVSGSTVIANQIYVGSTNSASPPSGTASLIMTNNAVITGSGSSSANVFVGQNGIFGGNGTVNGNVTNEGGILQVGASPDPLTITGNYSQTGGAIDLVVDSNGSGGYLTDMLVLDPGATLSLVDVNFDVTYGPGVNSTDFLDMFANSADALASFFDVAGLSAADLEAALADYTEVGGNFDANDSTVSLDAPAPVPEPGSLALFATALIGLAVRLRWRRQAG